MPRRSKHYGKELEDLSETEKRDVLDRAFLGAVRKHCKTNTDMAVFVGGRVLHVNPHDLKRIMKLPRVEREQEILKVGKEPKSL